MKRSILQGGSLLRTVLSNLYSPAVQNSRSYPAVPKRFYRQVNVISNDNKSYEIVLDSNKLKTPLGNTLQIGHRSLALAVAAEWDSQKDKIERSTMHLTALCNTVQDNPNNLDEDALVSSLLSYLFTDAVLYHYQETDDLYTLQTCTWGPVIDWFNRRYGVNVAPINDVSFSFNNEAYKETLRRHLKCYSFPCLQGLVFATESLKSLILTLCCAEQEISVEQAVLLSRLEEEYQIEKWGRVEWSHDLNVADLQSRVSAAMVFIRLHLEPSKIPSELRKIFFEDDGRQLCEKD